MRALNSLGGHVNSIAQLQWLWGGQDNPYAKVYRILSLEYLRKHCLPYIFNSRVNVYAKHIKYRFRMLEGVAKPDNFTRMKEFWKEKRRLPWSYWLILIKWIIDKRARESGILLGSIIWVVVDMLKSLRIKIKCIGYDIWVSLGYLSDGC